MRDSIVASNTYINQAFLDDDVSRRLDVKLEDGVAVDVKLTYKDANAKELGVFNDETFVENNHISYPFNIEEVAKNINIELDAIDHIVAAVDIDADGKIAKGEELKLNIIQPLHILILVAGTTDPVNADDEGSRAISYESESIYWDHKEKSTNKDKKFYDQVRDFSKEYKNLKLFSFHGWTGDNRIKNRKIAGAYLVNRLCGAEGQKPFYENSYQNRPIYFHLLGHSHGGNVINEMTQQMDKLGERWPKKWKVKSITYLSTPFFTKIHQVKITEKIFHSDAEILSLYNDYDLTQRMLADFSMEPLAGAIHGLNTEDLINEIDNLIASSEEVPFEYLKSWSLNVTHEEGVELYSKTIAMLDKLKDIFVEILKILKILNKEYTFAVDEDIVDSQGNRLPNKRQLLSDSVYKQFQGIFRVLEGDVDLVIETLATIQRTNLTKNFSKLEYFNALLESTSFIQHLNELLDINSKTLSSVKRPSLWTLLVQVLKENIKEFDNTYQRPEDGKQFSGVNIKINDSINVTKRDMYDGSQGSKNYQRFIKKIEDIEKSYEKNPSEYNLLDLLFTLLAQDEKVYKTVKVIADWKTVLDYSEYIVTGDVDKTVKALKHTLINLEEVFDERRFGKNTIEKDGIIYRSSLVDERYNSSAKHSLQPGSLIYLLQESHSTSRRVLHKEVKDFLKRLGAKR